MELKANLEWIRESNLIENIDSSQEDERCLRVWKELQRKRWTIDTILWVHRRIMWGLNRRIAGKFRDCNVRVGDRVCPNWRTVLSSISSWVWLKEYVYERGELAIKQSHIEFEKIHPFKDGNGRVGRMLMNWQRKKGKFEPLLIKKSERFFYYEWFE